MGAIASRLSAMGQNAASRMADIITSGGERQAAILRAIAEARAQGDIAKANLLSQMVSQLGQIPQQVVGFQDMMRRRKTEEDVSRARIGESEAATERYRVGTLAEKDKAIFARLALTDSQESYERTLKELEAEGRSTPEDTAKAMAVPWTPELPRKASILAYGPPKAAEGFTLGPGQARFGAGGTKIAEVAPTPERPLAPPTSVQEYQFSQTDPEYRKFMEGKKQLTPYQQEMLRMSEERLALAKKNASSMGLPPAVISKADSLARSFDSHPVVKQFNETAARYEGLKLLVEGEWTGPSDLAIVFEFMRALDPTSVVRESEYATAANSGNIFKGWAARFNGQLRPEGGFLSKQVRNDFMRALDQKVGVVKGQTKNIYTDFGRRIDRITGQTGTGTEWLTDYTEMLPEASAETTGQPGTAEEYLKKLEGRNAAR